MLEKEVLKQVQLDVSSHGPEVVRVFRNNVGLGWVGKSKKYPTHVIIQNARPLHAGLCEGSSDLIGWTEIIITPEMVGSKVAVFTALEAKAPGGKITVAQAQFIKVVAQSGGIAGKVQFYQSFKNLLNMFYERIRK